MEGIPSRGEQYKDLLDGPLGLSADLTYLNHSKNFLCLNNTNYLASTESLWSFGIVINRNENLKHF